MLDSRLSVVAFAVRIRSLRTSSRQGPRQAALGQNLTLLARFYVIDDGWVNGRVGLLQLRDVLWGKDGLRFLNLRDDHVLFHTGRGEGFDVFHG